MPIVRPKKVESSLPPELEEQARSALYFQVASQYYDEKYTDIKTAFFSLVANSDSVTLETGKSLRFHDGLLRWQARSNWNVDTEEVYAALKGKTLSVESLLACVQKFNIEMLKSLVPGAVSEASATEYGVMQATPEFKGQVVERLEANEKLVESFRTNGKAADVPKTDAGAGLEPAVVGQPATQEMAVRAKTRRNPRTVERQQPAQS